MAHDDEESQTNWSREGMENKLRIAKLPKRKSLEMGLTFNSAKIPLRGETFLLKTNRRRVRISLKCC